MDGKHLERLTELVRSRYFGKYRGVVHSNTPDPTRRGRIEVRVPAVFEKQSVWAMPCVPFAGPNVGFHMLPPQGAGVWVEFEAGDLSYPIWSGCYWAADSVPVADANNTVKLIRTDQFTLRIDDAKGELVIENKSGVRLTMNALNIKLEAPDIQSIAKLRNLSVSAKSVSINDGTQEIT